MTLERGAIDDVELFVVTGQLEMSNIGALERATDEALDRGATLLLYDLTALDFLDSSVLALLERTRKRLERLHGHATVACSDAVARAFRLTHLDEVYSVEATREAALARLRAAAEAEL